MVFENTDLRIYPYPESNIKRVRALNENPTRALPNVETMGITVLILNLEKPELIIPLINSLELAHDDLKEKGLNLKVLIGDTGSKDTKILERYETSHKCVKVIDNLKYHFSKNNNTLFDTGICTSHTLLLNNDVIFKDTSYSLLKMYEACQGKCGISGPILTYPNGNIQHAGVDYFKTGPLKSLCYHPMHGTDFNVDVSIDIDVPAVTGACLMTQTNLYYKIGGLDELYDAECQDVAYCLSAAKLGIECRLINAGQIKHLENATRPKGHEHWPDRQRFVRKFGSFLEATQL